MEQEMETQTLNSNGGDPWAHLLFTCECVDVKLTNVHKQSDCLNEMMTQRQETTTDEMTTRKDGEAKRVYVQHQGKLESMTKRDLRNALSDTRKYMVHGGKIVKSEEIDRLKDNTVVHVVNKMPGGGKRKDRKKMSQTYQSSTDKSSSEVDMAFAIMGADSKSGRNGWNENLIQKMMGLNDEAMEDMMEKLKSSIRMSTDGGPESGLAESALEGLKKLLHERKLEARTQQKATATRRGSRRGKATTATRTRRSNKRSKSSARARQGGQRNGGTTTHAKEERGHRCDATKDIGESASVGTWGEPVERYTSKTYSTVSGWLARRRQTFTRLSLHSSFSKWMGTGRTTAEN